MSYQGKENSASGPVSLVEETGKLAKIKDGNNEVQLMLVATGVFSA